MTISNAVRANGSRTMHSDGIRDEARRLYVEERRTYRETAAALGLPDYTVATWVDRHGWTAQREAIAPPGEDVRQKAREMYVAGRGYTAVAKELGVSQWRMRRWAAVGKWADERRGNGGPPAPTSRAHHSPDKLDRALGLYLTGRTYAEIGAQLSVPRETIRNWSRENDWHAKREAARAAAPKHDTRTPAQREAMARASAEIRSGFLALRPVAPPSQEEADRAVREWLARNRPTVCPPAYAAPVADETIRPSYRGGARL